MDGYTTVTSPLPVIPYTSAGWFDLVLVGGLGDIDSPRSPHGHKRGATADEILRATGMSRRARKAAIALGVSLFGSVETATIGPWTVQLEAECAERINAARLRHAVVLACGRHPLAGARLRVPEPDARSHEWLTGARFDIDPVTVADCEDHEALAELRSRLYSSPIALDVSPPLRVVLAHRGDGDIVLLSAATWRLTGSARCD